LIPLHLEVTLSDDKGGSIYNLEAMGGAEWLRTNIVAFPVLGIAKSSIN
jgi:hypothetical protein